MAFIQDEQGNILQFNEDTIPTFCGGAASSYLMRSLMVPAKLSSNDKLHITETTMSPTEVEKPEIRVSQQPPDVIRLSKELLPSAGASDPAADPSSYPAAAPTNKLSSGGGFVGKGVGQEAATVADALNEMKNPVVTSRLLLKQKRKKSESSSSSSESSESSSEDSDSEEERRRRRKRKKKKKKKKTKKTKKSKKEDANDGTKMKGNGKGKGIGKSTMKKKMNLLNIVDG